MDSNHSMNSTEVSHIVMGTSGMTINFIVLCHLYSLVKQSVTKGSSQQNISTVKPDTDINSDSDTAFIFSTADCEVYDRLTVDDYGQCATEVGPYNYDRDLHDMLQFTNCFWFFFMTKMGAIDKCSSVFLGHDNNTKGENAMASLSKRRSFLSFMTDSLGLNDVCEKNSNVTDVKKKASNSELC